MGDSTLTVGRAAFADRDWSIAFTHLAAADEDGDLGPEDLERWWLAGRMLGQGRDVRRIAERAHRTWLEVGRPDRAARSAFWLGMSLMQDGEPAQANGWLTRAASIVDEHALDTVERGYVLGSAALGALRSGAAGTAEDGFAQAYTYATRFGDPDLAALSQLGLGEAAIHLGRLREGVSRLDAAMLTVTAGETSPVLSGIVYCAVISLCMELCDLARAEEWTRALTRWCDEQPDMVPFRGQCLIHRAELLQVRGAWDDASERVLHAHALLEDQHHPAIGDSWYLRGELARIRGEVAAAEECYRQAAACGRDPQPGLALLRLSEGDAERAAAASRRVVQESAGRRDRTAILGAHVEIALAVGDVDAATSAVDELRRLAEEFETPLLRAVTTRADGELQLARGEHVAAHRCLREALSAWLEVGVPFEAARTRVSLGRACHALGDLDAAELEWETARAAFDELGAVPALHALDATVAARTDAPRPADDTAGGLTGRELEVLAHLVTGMTNREIADALVISEKTVSRHLSNMFTKLGVNSRAAATAYAYTHDLV